MLRTKLRYLDQWTERRRLVAAEYTHGLKDCPLVLPATPDWADSAWHLFVVRSKKRDELRSRLADDEIGTLIHYPVPPHMQLAYTDLGLSRQDLPVAGRLSDEVLSLPIGPQLSPLDVARVIGAVRAAFE